MRSGDRRVGDAAIDLNNNKGKQMHTSNPEPFVSAQEFIDAAESLASQVQAAQALSEQSEVDMIRELHSRMTILSAASTGVFSVIPVGCDDAEFMIKINQGVQYVRLLQALGLDVRNMPEAAIRGDEFAAALESFSTSAAKVSKLIRKAGF
jgi:hypothetical protein